MAFTANGYTSLEVFAKGGSFELACLPGGSVCKSGGAAAYKRLRFPLQDGVDYSVALHGCDVSLAYLCGGEAMQAKGITYLNADLTAPLDSAQLAAVYSAPCRETIHFTPFRGWMNDPNGLCHYDGLYHLFYQYNPHSQVWDNMYWGHATSRDLLHWRHMPIALEPQEELAGKEAMAGGAFSGSAVVAQDGIRLFYTRHAEVKGRPDTVTETQWTALCQGVEITGETMLLDGPAPDGARDIRDPKVWRQNGEYYMVLGSAIKGQAAVLLYKAQALDGPWTYTGPLYMVPQATQHSVVECPDLFPLGDRYALLEATTQYTDPSGRIQPVRCALGDFDGTHFTVHTKQLLDFGGNFYAAQSFLHQGRRLLFGWICDFYNEHRVYAGGACGSLSLPRELSLQNGRLHCRPAREVYTLKKECLYSGAGECMEIAGIPGNAYYASIRLAESCDFSLVLSQNGGDSLVLSQKDGIVALYSSRVPAVHFTAESKNVKEIEIFYDRRVAEVYLDDGLAVGTKTFYCDGLHGSFSAFFKEPCHVIQAELWSLQSVCS